MTRKDWPVILIASGLLLAGAAQAFVHGDVDALGGAFLALGSATVGAWLRGSAQGKEDDQS